MTKQDLVKLIADALTDLVKAGCAVENRQRWPVPVPRFRLFRSIVWPYEAPYAPLFDSVLVDLETWERLDRERMFPPIQYFFLRRRLDHVEIRNLARVIVEQASLDELRRTLHVIRCATRWACAIVAGDWERAAEFVVAAQREPDQELEAEVAL